MKVLITGASGKLGWAVSAGLAEAGYNVVGADISPPPDRKIFSRFHIVDLLAREQAYGLMDGMEAVIHLANHPNETLRDPQTMIHDNVSMNMNVFQASQDMGIGRIYFSSSIQAFGLDAIGRPGDYAPDGGMLPLRVEEVPAFARNHYALSKLLSEHILEYCVRRGMAAGVAIRFPLLLAMKDRAYYERMMKREKSGKSGHVSREGETYLSMADCTRLFAALLEKNPPGFRVLFPVSAKTFSGRAAEEVASGSFPGWKWRGESGRGSLVDLAGLKELLGWEPVD